MIDIQLLRTDLEGVVGRLQGRGGEPLSVANFLRLESRRKELQQLVEGTQASRNKIAKEIGQTKAKGGDVRPLMTQADRVKALLATNEQQLQEIQEELQKELLGIPNIPHDSVPLGSLAADNKVIRSWGVPRAFDFPAKDHVDIGEALGGLDFATAAKISTARFVVMKGGIARLHRAIGQFMLDVHTREHGYTEIYAPYLVSAESMKNTGQLPKFEQDLFVSTPGGEFLQAIFNKDLARLHLAKLYLIPTAEVPVTNMVADEIIPGEKLPQMFVCHTPCFRSEAGSYGKDTRGMIRQHQFDKVELVRIEHPAKSYQALEELTVHAEAILQKLELPYRTVVLCTGDMGFAAAKTYDIEVWLPGQNAYREISSCSNFEAFQARRMRARFRNEKGRPELVHPLNGSGLAVGRTLVAILENFQNADGSVSIPAALRPYMNGADRIAKA